MRAGARRGFGLAAVLVGATFLLANTTLLGGGVIALRDGERFYQPYFMLLGDCARAGQLLLWNPWSAGGVPEYAEPQIGTFSPLSLAFAFVTGGTVWGYRLYWLCAWGLGGAGFLVLAKHLRAPAWAAAVVALGFLFSGQYTCGAPWTAHLMTISWFPFVLWRTDVALQSRRWRPACEAGALWGLSALGGYPGLTITGGCFLVPWALGRWLARRGARSAALAAGADASGTNLRSVVRTLATVVVVGGIVLAPSYVGFFVELAGYARRTEALSRAGAVSSNAFDPAAFVTFASPWLSIVKLHARAILWPKTWVESCSVYLGSGIPLLALLALARPSRWRLALVAMAAFAAACSVGEALPLRGWLFDWFPPFRYFQHSAMLRVYVLFALAVLALLGARDLERRLAERGPRLGLQVLAVGLVLCGAAWWGIRLAARDASLETPLPWIARAQLLVAWGGVCALGAALVFPLRRALLAPALLLSIAAVDAVLVVRISAPLMYSSANRDLWREVEREHEPALDLTARGLDRRYRSEYLPLEPHGPRNDNLPTKVPTFLSYSTSWNDFYEMFVALPQVFGMAIGADRLLFSERPVFLPASLEAASAFATRVWKADGAAPVVLHEREQMQGSSAGAAFDPEALAQAPAALRLGATVESYGMRELRLVVDCPAPGWLVVTDRWTPGWRASVDDEEVELLGGNFLFRAVPVHAGANRIRFTYRPFGLPYLAWASWGTLALVGACALRARLARRPP